MKEGQVVASEVRQDLDHPVDHTGPHLAVDALLGLIVVLDEAFGSVKVV